MSDVIKERLVVRRPYRGTDGHGGGSAPAFFTETTRKEVSAENVAQSFNARLASHEEYLTWSMKKFQQAVHQTARDSGFHDKETEFGTAVALIHSELSEALEADRMGDGLIEISGQAFSGVEEELADTIIRILDLAESRGYDVIGAMLAKAEHNKTRAHMHGGKKY